MSMPLLLHVRNFLKSHDGFAMWFSKHMSLIDVARWIWQVAIAQGVVSKFDNACTECQPRTHMQATRKIRDPHIDTLAACIPYQL